MGRLMKMAISATIFAALIVIALITFGIMTESVDFRVAAFIFAYFTAAHGLSWCIRAWYRRSRTDAC
jgi:hypothetical protein